MATTHNTEHQLAVSGYPSSFQLALAIKLVRSKPSCLSVAEYIHILRKCFQTMPHTAWQPQTQNRPCVFDPTMYWKLLYQKSCAHDEAQKNKISELERQFQSDNTRCTLPSTTDGERKRPGEPMGRVTKRNKTNKRTDLFILDDEFESSLKNCSGDACHTLLRHIFTLESITREGASPPDFDDLAKLLRDASDTLNNLLSTFRKSTFSSSTTDAASSCQENGEPFLHALGRTVQLLARGFNLLIMRPSSGLHGNPPSSPGATVYSLTSLFRQILSCIKTTARQPTTAHPPISNTSNTTKSKKKAVSPPKQPLEYPQTLLKPLTNLAYTFLMAFLPIPTTTVLDSNNPTADLHDSVLQILLTRAGTLLHTLTFSIPISQLTSPIIPPATSPEAHTMHLEARSLAPLIHYLLRSQNNKPPQPYLLPRSTNNTILNDGTGDGRNKDIMNPSVRTLQNTLVRGIFGRAERDIVGIGEGLKVVEQVEMVMEGGVEEGGKLGEGMWFVQWMWEMVGWDVLAEGLICEGLA